MTQHHRHNRRERSEERAAAGREARCDGAATISNHHVFFPRLQRRNGPFTTLRLRLLPGFA
jgi:hypothetical protein